MNDEMKNNEELMKGHLKETATSYLSLLQQTHDQALFDNEIQTKRWEDYRKDHEDLSSRLLSLRDKLSHEIMVPFGKKLLMRGKLVHTNEILTSLGDGWFVKQSAKEAVELCGRRIQHCDEMLSKLKKEKDLLTSRKEFALDKEVFGLEETQEVIELYDEEVEKEWRVKHRQKEREYRQKLSELKKAENNKIETEEDLWSRLDALDMQEELEDELNRLNEDNEESEEDTQESDGDDSNDEAGSERENSNNELIKDNADEEQLEICALKPLKRKVSFKENIRETRKEETFFSENDFIHITFRHSDVASPAPSVGEEIQTPADIYHHYIKQKQPKSILKPSTSVEDSRTDILQDLISQSISEDLTRQKEEVVPVHEPLVPAIGDVIEEHTPNSDSVPASTSYTDRPVSQFKARRMAKKR